MIKQLYPERGGGDNISLNVRVVPRLSRKRGTYISFVCLSVTKTLTWLISSKIFMIEY